MDKELVEEYKEPEIFVKVRNNFSKYQYKVEQYKNLINGQNEYGYRVKLNSIIKNLLTAEKSDKTGNFPKISEWINQHKLESDIVITDLKSILSNHGLTIWSSVRAIEKKYKPDVQHDWLIRISLQLEIYGSRLVNLLSSKEFLQEFDKLPLMVKLNVIVLLSKNIQYSDSLLNYVNKSFFIGVNDAQPLPIYSINKKKAIVESIGNIKDSGSMLVALTMSMEQTYNLSFIFSKEITFNPTKYKKSLGIVFKEFEKTLNLLVEISKIPRDSIAHFAGFDPNIDVYLQSHIREKSKKLLEIKKGLGPVRLEVINIIHFMQGILSVIDVGLAFHNIHNKQKPTQAELIALGASLADAAKTALEISGKSIPAWLSKGGFALSTISTMYTMQQNAEEGNGAGLLGTYIMAFGGALGSVGLVPLGAAVTALGFGVTFLEPGPFQKWVQHGYYGNNWDKNLSYDGSQGPAYVNFGFNKITRQVLKYNSWIKMPQASGKMEEISNDTYSSVENNFSNLKEIDELNKKYPNKQELQKDYKEVVFTIKELSFVSDDKPSKLYDKLIFNFRFWDSYRFQKRFFFESPNLYLHREKAFSPPYIGWQSEDVKFIFMNEVGDGSGKRLSEIYFYFLIRKSSIPYDKDGINSISFLSTEIEVRFYNFLIQKEGKPNFRLISGFSHD